MQITWNTDVNAPCCPGEILAEDGRSLLIQTDWDYPGTANSFGWSVTQVQKCPACGHVESCEPEYDEETGNQTGHCGGTCECRVRSFAICHHSTDGTVDCKECGVKASEFIDAAYNWLVANDGATADDPGYFSE